MSGEQRNYPLLAGRVVGGGLALAGVVLIVAGYLRPAIDVGVIIRGVMMYGGLGVLLTGLAVLGVLAVIARRS